MLVELAAEVGLNPKRVSSTHGGEFHSPCPACGGSDRFMIWRERERYWCRQCKISGDVLQFCRDFCGMSFQEARAKVGGGNSLSTPTRHALPFAHLPSSWSERASAFVASAHRRLLVDPTGLGLAKARGLTSETVERHQIGWNPVPVFADREVWGLAKKIEHGHEKRLFLPPGLVIPAFQEGRLCKVKVRRSDWKEGDCFGKYYILPGSVDVTSLFGDPRQPVVVVVEAELDAMLVAQESGDLCSCLALGGAQKRPPESVRAWLAERRLVLFALDFDEGGKREYEWWQTTFANLEPWPVPEEKSPGDFFRKGGSLRAWIESATRLFSDRLILT